MGPLTGEHRPSIRDMEVVGAAESDPNAKYSHIRWPVAMKDSRDVCLACARWAMLSRSNSLHDLSADLAAAVCVGVNIDVPAASLQVGGLGVGQRCRALGGAGRVGADHEDHASVCAGHRGAVEMGHSRRAGKPIEVD